MRISSKAAVVASIFLLLGIALFIFAETTRPKITFSSTRGPNWTNWHYFSIAMFTLSAALYVVWYRLAEKDDG